MAKNSAINMDTDALATLTGAQTLTSKTLTAPKIDEILDANGNEEIEFVTTASAVNNLQVTNAATGSVPANSPKIEAVGADTDVDLVLGAKGAGKVKVGTDPVVTEAGSQTLTNKTLTQPSIGNFTSAGHTHADAAGGGTLNPTNALASAVPTTKGGTGLSAAPDAQGKVLISKADGSVVWATLTDGANITCTEGDGSITIAASASGFIWGEQATDVTAAANHGYISTKGTQIIVTLPGTAAAGDVVRITSVGTAGWQLKAATGDTIQFGNLVTIAGGYVESTDNHDAVEVVCVAANSAWQVVSSIGNLTVQTT